MRIYEDFVSEDEERGLVSELDPIMKRLIYEQAHWDDVSWRRLCIKILSSWFASWQAIHGYRETERTEWSPHNELIISRIRQVAFPPGTPQLHRVHVLDLKKSGVIKPHIDSVKFCGDTIAGLSLLSPSIMRLVHHEHPKDDSFTVDCLLPRRSLYVMSGPARYEYTHEILSNAESVFRGEPVVKGRRISVICRSEVTNKEAGNESDQNQYPRVTRLWR